MLSEYFTAASPSASLFDESKQKLLPAMIDDARSQAMRIASAAGLSVGNLLGIIEGASGSLVAFGYFASPGFANASIGGSTATTATASYSLTIKFALLR